MIIKQIKFLRNYHGIFFKGETVSYEEDGMVIKAKIPPGRLEDGREYWYLDNSGEDGVYEFKKRKNVG